MDVEDNRLVDVETIKTRFDVAYRPEGVTIEPHFCRSWDEEGGCYGTNPNHGFTAADACDEVAEHYERLAKMWRDRTHPDIRYYAEEQSNKLEECP